MIPHDPTTEMNATQPFEQCVRLMNVDMIILSMSPTSSQGKHKALLMFYCFTENYTFIAEDRSWI
jgi:hypothetical protein